jgi:RNA polymerase sigma-70 factor, ECF subfamily
VRLLSDPQSRAITMTDDMEASAFVQTHQAGLWRFLRSAGCDAALAEELTQDALLVALRRGICEREAPTAAAFLRTTARNLWMRHRHQDQRRQQRLIDAAELLWQRDAEADQGSELLANLQRCVAELPERSRMALERSYRDGATRAELASELKLTEHGVRNLMQRLRKALRKCIERRTQ